MKKKIKMEGTKYILIGFEEKEKLLLAFRLLKKKEIKILDVLSPFPIEELEEEKRERKSYIGGAGLVAGILALGAVLYFQLWISGKAYPLFYGGKPFDAWLSFVPVLFESVVLLVSITVVFTFLIEIRLFSKRKRLPKSKKFTNDNFAIVIENDSISETEESFLDDNFKIEKVEF